MHQGEGKYQWKTARPLSSGITSTIYIIHFEISKIRIENFQVTNWQHNKDQSYISNLSYISICLINNIIIFYHIHFSISMYLWSRSGFLRIEHTKTLVKSSTHKGPWPTRILFTQTFVSPVGKAVGTTVDESHQQNCRKKTMTLNYCGRKRLGKKPYLR